MNKINTIVGKIRENQKIVKFGLIVIAILLALAIFFINHKDNNVVVAEKSRQVHEKEMKEMSDEELMQGNNTTIFVDVQGKVNKPGVYELKQGSRVYNAIEKAGGITEGSNVSNVNQAQLLVDGQQIFIGEGTDNNSALSDYGTKLINLNNASAEELQKVNGVGPVMANKIIKFREANGGFKSIDDLYNVSGIGEKTFDNIKSSFTI